MKSGDNRSEGVETCSTEDGIIRGRDLHHEKDESHGRWGSIPTMMESAMAPSTWTGFPVNPTSGALMAWS